MADLVNDGSAGGGGGLALEGDILRGIEVAVGLSKEGRTGRQGVHPMGYGLSHGVNH